MSARQIFSQADLERVHAATVEAEEGSGGEIVVYVVGRCDAYRGACWRAAAFAAVMAAAAAGLAHALGGYWGGWGPLWITLPVAGAATIAYAATATWPSLRRWLTHPESLERRVEHRAAAAFIEEEVFATVDRTGVLIFLALFEHRVLILPDKGIRARVAEEEWQAIARSIAAGIREGRAPEALIEAVGRCGRLLAASGVARRADDRDELSSQPRLRDE
ncbi:MAG TPA: hypothetical protein VF017_15815 [Thermoanaerobaculia bacterium]|nr:hypothetical protein [Thermoanaerobaculia bacterium]